MEITYIIDYEKHYRTLQYYLKNSTNAKNSIQKTMLLLLWILCFFLTIPFSMLTIENGFCLSASLYFIVIFLFMIFSKYICRKLLLRTLETKLKEYDKDSISVIQKEDSISLKNKNGFTQHYWRSICDIERAEEFLLFTGPSVPFLIPRYAFQTQVDFESFYQKGRECLQVGEDRKKSPSKSYKALYLLPVVMSFLVLSTPSSAPPADPEYAKDAERFWQEVFGMGIPQVEYDLYTSDDFQKMITGEQWEKEVQSLKDQYGGLRSIYTVAYINFNNAPARAIVLCHILGDRKSCYIRNYLVKDSMGWQINGYDIIIPVNIDFNEEEFSLQEDRELLKEKLPDKIRIMDNSVLELSGYQND